MAGLSDEQVQDMQNTAGGSVDPNSYQSLAQVFQQELAKAQGVASRMQGLEKSQMETAKMIGDTSQLPKGMSPTETIARGNMAASTFAAEQAEYGQKNVLDILSNMITLKSKQDEYNLAKAKLIDETGVDPDTGEVVDDKYLQGVDWLLTQKGGAQVLDNISNLTESETEQVANAIKSHGSLSNYVAEFGTDILFSGNEKDANKAAQQLLVNAKSLIADVEDPDGKKKSVAGIGWLSSKITPQRWADTDVRSKIGEFTSGKLKELSGTAVSEQEYNRIVRDYLPKVSEDETVIADKMKTIAAALEVGQKMKEKAVENGIKLEEAYRAFGAEAFEEGGYEIPDWLQVNENQKKQDEFNTYKEMFDNL